MSVLCVDWNTNRWTRGFDSISHDKVDGRTMIIVNAYNNRASKAVITFN